MSLSDAMSRLTEQCLDAHESRIAAVKSIRTATTQQTADFRAAHEAMAVATRQHLTHFAETLHQDVTNLNHAHNAERQAMHAAQRASLDSYMDDLRSAVTASTKAHNAERQAMHAAQRASLDQSMKQLKLNVESLCAEAAADRGRNHADHMAAHQTWAQFSVTIGARRAGAAQPVAAQPVAAQPIHSETKPAVVGPAKDDLTVIRGIGNGMHGRLNQIGIFTFADLAESSSDQLRTALAESGRLANVEDWIAEARSLIAQP